VGARTLGGVGIGVGGVYTANPGLEYKTPIFTYPDPCEYGRCEFGYFQQVPAGILLTYARDWADTPIFAATCASPNQIPNVPGDENPNYLQQA
jgi:hypothetical protein